MSEHSPGDPHDLFRHRRPDFLVISPPKTGSTWLADNLRRHPQLFVPAIKEVKYFSSLYQWLDYGWYCDHFNGAGPRQAGEASPSYASLPLADIRNIRRLLPDVKLVFLMREPVARAWSHAKHNRRYREANFADASDTETTNQDQWRANFVHDWPLVAGDYLFCRAFELCGRFEENLVRTAAQAAASCAGGRPSSRPSNCTSASTNR